VVIRVVKKRQFWEVVISVGKVVISVVKKRLFWAVIRVVKKGKF